MGGKTLEVSGFWGHLKHLGRKYWVDRVDVCPMSGKRGRWERIVGVSVPGVREKGTMGTESGGKCAQCPEIRDTGNS